MFSPTACLPAVEEGSKDVPWSRDKPRGAYSCTLKEAGKPIHCRNSGSCVEQAAAE